MISIAQATALPPDLALLVEASLAEGFPFLARLRDEWASGANRFSKPGEAFFLARDHGELVGVCGLNQDPFASDPAVGRLRRLYVPARFRRQGVARTLVRHVLAFAGERFDVVRVRTNTERGDLFYRSLGFARLASSPDATHELRRMAGARSNSIT